MSAKPYRMTRAWKFRSKIAALEDSLVGVVTRLQCTGKACQRWRKGEFCSKPEENFCALEHTTFPCCAKFRLQIPAIWRQSQYDSASFIERQLAICARCLLLWSNASLVISDVQNMCAPISTEMKPAGQGRGL